MICCLHPCHTADQICSFDTWSLFDSCLFRLRFVLLLVLTRPPIMSLAHWKSYFSIYELVVRCVFFLLSVLCLIQVLYYPSFLVERVLHFHYGGFDHAHLVCGVFSLHVLTLGCSGLVVSTIASDWLEWLVSKMIRMLNHTRSLTCL